MLFNAIVCVGFAGSTGLPGPAGPIGPPGTPGGPGFPGATGFPGSRGATGASGPAGFAGGPGAIGATGFPGETLRVTVTLVKRISLSAMRCLILAYVFQRLLSYHKLQRLLYNSIYNVESWTQ